MKALGFYSFGTSLNSSHISLTNRVNLQNGSTVSSLRNIHSSPSLFAGHSKWANIKHAKKKSDAEKMAMFTKISKELLTSVRLGGNDPEYNGRLATALSRAKSYNYPKERIDYALNGGKSDKTLFEDVVYEGYGPGGVAVLVETLTDSRNRTSNVIKHLFAKHGGNMGGTGNVAWMFEKKGIITFDHKGKSEEEIMESVIEVGAEDMAMGTGTNNQTVEVICKPSEMMKVKKGLEERGFVVGSAEFNFIPTTTVEPDEESLQELHKMVEEFDVNEDVQQIYHNCIGPMK